MAASIDSYKKISSLGENRLILLPEGCPIDSKKIGQGILFIASIWSGPSKQSFEFLNFVLLQRKDATGVKVHVADIESKYAQDFVIENRGTLDGTGETYWIKNGVVIGKVKACTEANADLIKTYTDQLLGEEGAAGPMGVVTQQSSAPKTPSNPAHSRSSSDASPDDDTTKRP